MTRHYLLILTFMLALTGCATEGVSDQPTVESKLEEWGLVRGETIVRIPNFNITSWRSINNKSLVVTTGVRTNYLLELQHSCQELRSAFGIGFDSKSATLNRYDSVIVRTNQNRGGRRCPIAEMTRLNEAESDS